MGPDGVAGIPFPVIVNRLLQRFRQSKFSPLRLLLRRFAYGKSDSARHNPMSLSAATLILRRYFDQSGECFASVSPA